MKAKRLFFLVMAICFANGLRAQNHTGVYTHGSVGRSNTGETITVPKQVLNVEFYDSYIKVNGSEAKFIVENVLPSSTKTVTLRPGTRVKIYQQYVDGFAVNYLVDSNYNMEALWMKNLGNNNFLNYFFPIEKGNTMSSNNVGSYNGGNYGGGYSGGSSGGSTGNSRTVPQQSEKKRKYCGVCHGSGKCNTCNGTGWVTRMGMGKDGYCASCPNHSGRCSACNGRGEWYE
ncbi:MAG: hypothetical protein J6W52_01380 [Bacteroidaceae bacterium]|nr:hypothetical protein [Bacteroidaceae bacterium]